MARYNSTDDLSADAMILALNKRLEALEAQADNFSSRSKVFRFFATSTNIVSTTNVDVVGFVTTFEKLNALTWLRIDLRASGSANATITGVDFAVSITGQPTQYLDRDVTHFEFATSTARQYSSSQRNVPDVIGNTPIEAGTVTVQVRARVSGNQFTYDTGDHMTLIVSEVEPL